MAANDDGNEMNTKSVVKVCKDCKMSFTDIYAYTEHLESKQHRKTLMKNKYGEKYLEAKAKLNSQTAEDESEASFDMLSAYDKKIKKCDKELLENDKKQGSSSKDDSDDDDDEVYPCNVCEKVCTGLITYQLHLEGRKHRKNVQKRALLKEMQSQNLIPVLNDAPREDSLFDRVFPERRQALAVIDCKACKKKCLSPEAYNQHCKSASHQKKVALEELLKDMDVGDLSPLKVQMEENAPFAECVTCNKTFSGPLPHMQHLQSPAHLKMVRRMDALGLIQNLIVSKEDDSKFNCKDCGKSFSGPIPFNAHLKSSAHGKMKKKSDLAKKLEEHPDLVKKYHLDSDSDEEKILMLGCNVCKVVFSGPEAANDHFTSLNHKKAKKQKKLFKEFKQQRKAATSNEAIAKKSESDDSSDFEKEFDIIKV